MKHPVSKHLSLTGNYSEKELMLLGNLLYLKTLEKDEFLLKKGEVCSNIYFIAKSTGI